MSIVLFAIIGAKLNLGTAYWISFGLYCAFRVIKCVVDTIKEMD